ncbi:MAG: hypothetical protein H5U04_11565 [Firmicutes bacterium]|nr:hypothetical protein [Bacillota bacterium]
MIGKQQVRAVLDEVVYLVSLHRSMLFALSALVPLYPVGRAVIIHGPPAGEGGQYSRTQLEALITVTALGVAVLFLPLYVRLVIDALRAFEGGEAS